MMRAVLALLAALAPGCTRFDILDAGEPEGLPHADDAPRWSFEGYTARLSMREGSPVLTSNLPMNTVSCAHFNHTAEVCADRDGDGLVDAWEDMVLHKLRPVVRFHQDEALFHDPDAVVASIGRVTRAPHEPHRVVVLLSLDYSRDYGRCSFGEHDGDSERVALELSPIHDGADARAYAITAAYTAAHEGSSIDSGRVYVGPDLIDLDWVTDPVSGDARWRVYAARGKHATYASSLACDTALAAPCQADVCAPADGDAPELLFPVWNAGEPHAPRPGVQAFEAIFPDERVWSGRDFCGGLRYLGGSCASPLTEKLVVDPFW